MMSRGELSGGVGIGSGGDDGNDNHDRRMKAVVQKEDEQAQQPPLQLHRPLKCPRCDSMNTKFCYYNNYSFSQPRYFCKTCRRYWTHGGSLRNVPVGGGCRKGKRARTAGENSRSVPPQQPLQSALQVQLDFGAARSVMISSEQAKRVNEPGGLGSFGPYYQGGTGGYMSTLAALQSLNPSSQPAFNQSMNARAGDISNLVLPAGFGVSALGLQRQQHFNPSPAIYQAEQGLMPSTRVASGTTGVWTHGYLNDANNQRASEASLWSTMSSASINGDSDSNGNGSSGGDSGSSSLMPNPWPHLPGFGPSHP